MQEEELHAIEKQGLTDEEVEDAYVQTPQSPSPDETELEAAFWFHRSFLRKAIAGTSLAFDSLATVLKVMAESYAGAGVGYRKWHSSAPLSLSLELLPHIVDWLSYFTERIIIPNRQSPRPHRFPPLPNNRGNRQNDADFR